MRPRPHGDLFSNEDHGNEAQCDNLPFYLQVLVFPVIYWPVVHILRGGYDILFQIFRPRRPMPDKLIFRLIQPMPVRCSHCDQRTSQSSRGAVRHR